MIDIAAMIRHFQEVIVSSAILRMMLQLKFEKFGIFIQYMRSNGIGRSNFGYEFSWSRILILEMWMWSFVGFVLV